MERFKHFIANKGALLSQETEFLPYYALPYVPNPEGHPTYKHLFSAKWRADIIDRVKKAIASSQDYSIPALVKLVASSEESTSSSVDKRAASEVDKRLALAKKRFTRLHAEYQSVISVSADLVDALEASMRGEKLSSDFLQRLCSRLAATQQRNGPVLTQSLEKPNNAELGSTLRQSLQLSAEQWTARTSQMNEGDRENSYRSLDELDFDRLKSELRSGDSLQKAMLLQALRWRLTKTGAKDRDKWLQRFVEEDILGLRGGNTWIRDCLREEAQGLCEQTSRFLNTLASLSRGRSYLASNDLVLVIIERLFSCVSFDEMEEDSLLRDNLIGALQKLSLRRGIQSLIIKQHVIEWLVKLLENNGDKVSDYTLEYAVALTMNLCLRTKGKLACVPIASQVLKVLTDLLSHEENEILPYINGALYSILALPQIRRVANAMDLEGILSCFIKENSPEMNRQFEFIIKQLHLQDDKSASEAGEVSSDDEPFNDDDEEDEDDEEEGEGFEAFLDKNDSLLTNPDAEGLASGEALLNLYARPGVQEVEVEECAPLDRTLEDKSAKSVGRTSEADLSKSVVLTRPSTPGQMRPKPLIEGGRGDSALSSERRGSRVAADKITEHPDYQKAFNSKPRIPRTPDLSEDGSRDRDVDTRVHISARALLSQTPNQE